MIIAADGPTASGKGTIAKALVPHYGCRISIPACSIARLAVRYSSMAATRTIRAMLWAQPPSPITCSTIRNCAMNRPAGWRAAFRSIPRSGRRCSNGNAISPRSGGRRRARRARHRHGDRARGSGQAVCHRQRGSARAAAFEMRERGAGVNLLEIQDDLRRRDERDCTAQWPHWSPPTMPA